MKATIKNTSRAPQGVHTVDGLQFIEPGKTRSLNVADDYGARLKALSFFEVGEDIDRPPTESDIAEWSRDRLVEATMEGIRQEVLRASDEDLRHGLAGMYARAADRDAFDPDGEGAKSDSVPSERDELKRQAAELELAHPRNISTEKLKDLIDAKLAE